MKKWVIVLILCALGSWVSISAQEKVDTLSAAIVQTNKEKLAARTQTSMQKLDTVKIKRGFAVLGSPDLIKTLQMFPGVASGTELSSGLYVRGGDGSDNLFLLDGVPLYQVSHVIGLFSSFNTDVTENVDFYKGGFPARYGGRLSSVVDVGVKTGNFTKWKGSASLGLIDGRIQLEGPIIKDKTSINVGIRRTWLDIIKSLAMGVVRMRSNSENMEDIMNYTHYDFGDVNLKLTHLLGETGKLSFSAYYGHDVLSAKGYMSSETDSDSESRLQARLKWGNILSSFRYEKFWPQNGWSTDTKLYYTNYTSDITMDTYVKEISTSEDEPAQKTEISLNECDLSRIHDIGVSSDWLFDGLDGHHIRTGINAVGHIYDPYRKLDMELKMNTIKYDELHNANSIEYLGAEVGLYIEDEISLMDRLVANFGLRESAYFVRERFYNSLEPRLALKYDVNDKFTLKTSYARMSQFSHLVSACYMDLPSNLWMPSTSKVKPMSSGQFVLGATFRPSSELMVDVESFYKKMNHLYEYNGTNTLLPSLERWEMDYLEGRGRSYGAELSIEYFAQKFSGALYYTLSRSERYFPSYYYTWFPDRNDNRHKLTLSANYRFSRNFEVYACWTYHTGNRFTAPSSVVWSTAEEDVSNESPTYIYSMPNNYLLPDYHRLDVGLNWHKRLADGKSRTLNVSVYNAYNRLNAFFGTVDVANDKIVGSAYGIVPIIPSISYMWRF